MRIIITLSTALIVWIGSGCSQKFDEIDVYPSLENRTEDGGFYTPYVPSLLRTHSALEDMNQLALTVDKRGVGNMKLTDSVSDNYLEIKNIPLKYLVPRLPYGPNEPPDDFDALNLMLAEFSKNGMSLPVGKSRNEEAYCETNLSESVPWISKGDDDFTPNPMYRPLRVSVINNSLRARLWELNAIDESGEIYHSWFEMPEDYYFNLVARVNQLDEQYIRESLIWNDRKIPLDMGRLRTVDKNLGTTEIYVKDESLNYRPRDSYQKFSQHFLLLDSQDEIDRWIRPQFISDFHRYTARVTHFIEPGVYTVKDEGHSFFDCRFLGTAVDASIKIVSPKTRYSNDRANGHTAESNKYLEFTLNFADEEKIIIGNLPAYLLVNQEEYVIHGFGVGILPARDSAVKRDLLMSNGHCPSYAYLARSEDGELLALDVSERGMEQIFIRSHPDAELPHWEITLTSHESIVDLAKYILPMPQELVLEQKASTQNYTPPAYFTSR